MLDKKIIKTAFKKSIPIMCSYLFIDFAYGLMMKKAGFAWYVAFFISFFVYTGAFQFVLIPFLTSHVSLLTLAITALLMNSRQTFYSLTFIHDFKKMGIKKWYMIHTLTDETYAVNCTLDEDNKDAVMFYVALFSRIYWLFGTIVGSVAGSLIPIDLKGIDFCMTALFVIIFMDQWTQTKDHFPALSGVIIAFICLLIFSSQQFMLPSLIIVSLLLLLNQGKETKNG